MTDPITPQESDAGLSDGHSESYRDGWRAGRALGQADTACKEEWERWHSGAAAPEIAETEEPIEHRLRRAFLNGFKEGVERAAQSVEDWGRWDS